MEATRPLLTGGEGVLSWCQRGVSANLVIPLAPDLFSLEGLRNLGPALLRWREDWAERKAKNPIEGLSLPGGEMDPAGYVVLQHAMRLDRPVAAYGRWLERIPGTYRSAVVKNDFRKTLTVAEDELCLAALKHYGGLTPLAQDARKPMFSLTAADGALGGTATAVQACYRDFRDLARRIAERCGVALA